MSQSSVICIQCRDVTACKIKNCNFTFNSIGDFKKHLTISLCHKHLSDNQKLAIVERANEALRSSNSGTASSNSAVSSNTRNGTLGQTLSANQQLTTPNNPLQVPVPPGSRIADGDNTNNIIAGDRVDNLDTSDGNHEDTSDGIPDLNGLVEGFATNLGLDGFECEWTILPEDFQVPDYKTLFIPSIHGHIVPKDVETIATEVRSSSGDQWKILKERREKDLGPYSKYVNQVRKQIRNCHDKKNALDKKAAKATSWKEHGITAISKPIDSLVSAIKQYLDEDQATVFQDSLTVLHEEIGKTIVSTRKEKADKYRISDEILWQVKEKLKPYVSETRGMFNKNRFNSLLWTHVYLLDLLSDYANREQRQEGEEMLASTAVDSVLPIATTSSVPLSLPSVSNQGRQHSSINSGHPNIRSSASGTNNSGNNEDQLSSLYTMMEQLVDKKISKKLDPLNHKLDQIFNKLPRSKNGTGTASALDGRKHSSVRFNNGNSSNTGTMTRNGQMTPRQNNGTGNNRRNNDGSNGHLRQRNSGTDIHSSESNFVSHDRQGSDDTRPKRKKQHNNGVQVNDHQANEDGHRHLMTNDDGTPTSSGQGHTGTRRADNHRNQRRQNSSNRGTDVTGIARSDSNTMAITRDHSLGGRSSGTNKRKRSHSNDANGQSGSFPVSNRNTSVWYNSNRHNVSGSKNGERRGPRPRNK